MTDKLTHCVCGCIYKESNCPNCNKVTDNQRIEELEAQVEGCLAVIATERDEVLALRRKLEEEREATWKLLETPYKLAFEVCQEKLAKAVEALEWQADAIHNSITVNMKHNHRILLDGIYHEGPLVDWVHKILTGFEAINRTTLAELKGEQDGTV